MAVPTTSEKTSSPKASDAGGETKGKLNEVGVDVGGVQDVGSARKANGSDSKDALSATPFRQIVAALIVDATVAVLRGGVYVTKIAVLPVSVGALLAVADAFFRHRVLLPMWKKRAAPPGRPHSNAGSPPGTRHLALMLSAALQLLAAFFVCAGVAALYSFRSELGKRTFFRDMLTFSKWGGAIAFAAFMSAAVYDLNDAITYYANSGGGTGRNTDGSATSGPGAKSLMRGFEVFHLAVGVLVVLFSYTLFSPQPTPQIAPSPTSA